MKQYLKYTLLLLLTLSTGHLYAKLQGQARIDSLLKELPKQMEDTNKVRMFSLLSSGYSTINPDEGIKFGNEGLELAQKLDWKKGIAAANGSLGINYQYKSNYPKALEYFFKALKLHEDIGNKAGIAAYSCNIGIIYGYQKDYPKALEYYFKALKLDEEGGYKQYAASVNSNISGVYLGQGDYPKAYEYSIKALKEFEELGNKGGIASNTCNIGVEYLHQKNYIMAVEYLQRALKLYEELGDKYGMAASLDNIGSIYIEIVKDTAVKTGRVTVATELPESKYQPTASIPKGKVALLAGAIDYEQRSMAICKEINSLDVLQECYENLTEAYKLKGDYKHAMEYGDSLKVIKDSVFSQTNREQITKLENKRKEFADSLKAAAEQKAAGVKAAHRRNYELIGAAAFLLLLGFTFLLTRNNKLLGKEKKRSDDLLLNILPEEVACQLKDTGAAAAKQFDNVTVLFTDFVNFTEAGERMKPGELIEELNTCFKKFDEITAAHNIEKIKTIGDAYLAVAGLPTPDPKHAENVVRAAKEISAFMQDRIAKVGNRTFEIRIGVHSGSVVAGIVGIKKFAYDIWGDTVNTAARMEQNSEPGRVNISETTYELVKDKIDCEYRGEIEAKGKGMMKMYYVSAGASA